MQHRSTWIGAAAISALFVLGMMWLLLNQSDVLRQTRENYLDRKALNLDRGLSEDALSSFLVEQGYFDDERDAWCVAAWITNKVHAQGSLPNLGVLNSTDFAMPVSMAMEQGGERLRTRAQKSMERLGLDKAQVPSISPKGENNTPAKKAEQGEPGLICVVVRDEHGKVEGVPVRLKEHYFIESGVEGAGMSQMAADSVVGYATTNANGEAQFAVTQGKYYSVLPVRAGFEYGAAKGTKRGPISKQLTTYGFRQQEHRIKPLDTFTYNRIKSDVSLTVRTPLNYRNNLLMSVLLCLLAWWAGLFFIHRMDLRHKRSSDHGVLLLLMTLTLLGVLTMYSIQQPLTDKLLGMTMTWGTIVGVVAMCLLSQLNVLRYYASQSRVQRRRLRFDFVVQGLQKLNIQSLNDKMRQWPDGIGYLLLAMVLVVLLRLFGTGPEGSDARVNLFFFQPSEVSKYLVVVFIAAFFATNASRIQRFAERHDRNTLRFQLRMMVGVVVAMCVLLAMYLMLLSDMGPALVMMLTFIFLYSIARRDFGQMLLGTVTFSLLLVAGYWWGHDYSTMLLMALAWFVVWVAVWWWRKHRVYESALFLNLLIMAFIFGGAVLTKLGMTEGQRLTNRTQAAWSGVWHNDVPGGDQVAQGIWSLSTGGLTGTGLGKGNPNLVPANHTDMVFTSIGETMGWIGLVLVLVCVALLIHRSLKLARRAGHPFAFYLAAGIAIVTGVQFFVIVFGSIGFIPLTGVSVPFLSYGMSSLIINMAAYGVVVSVSRVRPTANQRQEVKKYDNVVIASMLTFMSFSLLLIGSLFYYQVVARDQYLVKPACVVNLDGAIDMEYNPRIDILMRHLDAGNIYDRNGLLLAASEADELTHNQAALMKAGADGRTLQRLVKKRLRRYYPFGDHFFFMLGDYNTRALWGSPEAMPVGYMAENRHLTELRGFDNVVRDGRGRPVKDVMTTNTYRESPFLPSVKRTLAFTRYDYSNPTLLAMLKGGIDSEEVKEWNAQRNRRDLTLTLDARLQVQLQKDMQNMIEKNSTWLSRRRLRASVVVLDAARGDLLCSANYPLPNQDSLRYLADQHKYVYNDHSLQQAYTDRDLGLTYQTQPGSTAKVMSAMAGLMRYGVDAANIKYQVRAQETVEPSSVEPWGNVTMNVAIVRSSNCYFVNLVHDKDLYPELQRIYTITGVRIDHPRMRTTDAYASHTPYIFDMESFSDSLDYGSEMQYLQNLGLKTYRDYVEHRQSQKKYERMSWWQCALAWGQGTLTATPLNMARVVSVVANDGQFVPTRYVLQRGTGASAVRQPVNTSIPVLSSQAAGLLKSYMQQESDKHRRQGRALPQPLNPLLRMGGKTGTPERVSGGAMEARRDQNGRRYWAYPCMNDGWYVFFIRSERQQGPLAVAVRLERLGVGSGNTSGAAVEFVANTVIPSLNRAGYKVN